MDKYDQVVGCIANNWFGALLLLIFAFLAALPQVRDGATMVWSWIRRPFNRRYASLDDSPIVLDTGEERVTFTELLRSTEHDVVRVNAHSHELGIVAEHEWIRRRYPKGEHRKQALTTYQALSGKKKGKEIEVPFDVITIELPGGRQKQIYFDISSFFGGGRSTTLDPESALARKLVELYK